MRKSGRKRRSRDSDFEQLRGGELPQDAVLRHFARLKRDWAAELNDDSAIRQQATKYLRQLAPPVARNTDEKSANAIDELRAITDQLAKRKLAAPRKRHVIPDTWGSYSLRFTPPYLGMGTYSVGSISSVSGEPVISASGVDALGQLSCSVHSNHDKPSAGTASNVMGVYFKPMFSQANARVSFESDIAFSWYVNSIRNKVGRVRAQGMIRLYQYDGAFVQPSLHSGAFIGFSIYAENEIKFNAHSNAGPTWHLEAPVSSNHHYFVVISLDCSASGAGWPGSLAGVSTMVTVPSITVSITGEPVLQPFS